MYNQKTVSLFLWSQRTWISTDDFNDTALVSHPGCWNRLYAYIYLPNTYLVSSGLLNVIPSCILGDFLFVFVIVNIIITTITIFNADLVPK